MRDALLGCLVALIVCSLSGCSGSNESGREEATAGDRLIGQWHGQVEIDSKEAKKLSDDAVELLENTELKVEFRADGTMILTGKDGDKDYESGGTWEVLSEDGDELTVKSVEDEGLEKDLSLRFEGADAFSMPLPDQMSHLGAMRFRRLR